MRPPKDCASEGSGEGALDGLAELVGAVASDVLDSLDVASVLSYSESESGSLSDAPALSVTEAPPEAAAAAPQVPAAAVAAAPAAAGTATVGTRWLEQHGLRELPNWVFQRATDNTIVGRLHVVGPSSLKATCRQHGARCHLWVTCAGCHDRAEELLVGWLAESCGKEEHAAAGVRVKESLGMKPRPKNLR